jgi:gliding motility-associated-like protein
MMTKGIIVLFLGILSFSITATSQTTIVLAEICDNGLDDDNDGLIDGFDPDCIGIGTNCSGNFGDNLFLKGDFGTTADGRNPTQPNPANNLSMVLGNPLAAGVTSYNFGFNLTDGCPAGGNCWTGDGNYIIATNTFGMLNPPNTNFYAWQPIHDNSGRQDGYMMVVNAGIQPDIFFKQTITNLCPNTTYYFSIDVTNLFRRSFTAIKPNISFIMAPAGTTLATMKTQPALYSTGDIPQDEQWHTYGFAFVTPPDVTSAEFAIRNNNPGGFGNDLCLDNIRLRPCFPNIDLKVNKNVFCGNDTLNLTVQNASQLRFFYQWQFSNDGGTTWQNLTGKTADICTLPNFQLANEGMYRVIASPNPNANCRYTSPPIVVKYAPPVTVAIRGNPQFCVGDSTILDASGDFLKYTWSNGATTPTIRIKQGGNYAVTVTDKNGCVGQTAFQTNTFPTAVPSVKGNTQFCTGDSTVLEVQGDFQNYAWSNGATTPKITIKTSGNYAVLVTDRNGCKGQTALQITAIPSLKPVINGNFQFCTGDSTNLEIQENFAQFAWSNGANVAEITVTQAGTYTVTVTDRSGCKGENTVQVKSTPSVPATIKGNTEFCTGDSTKLEVQGDFQNYKWSNGVTNSNITVRQSGIYGVTTTDRNGCKSQTQVTTTVSASLAVLIKGNPQFCVGDSTVLEVQGDFQSYAWSNGVNIPKNIVKQIGTYTVTVVDKSGCKGQSNTQVTTTPAISVIIKGNMQFCAGDSTTLTVQGDFHNYLWSNEAKTPTITVKTSGNYAVSVIDKNGCKASATTQVTATPSVIPTIKGNTSFCTGDNTTLEVVGDFQQYAWSNGEKTAKITVNQAGIFNVTVTDRNGCIGQSSVETKVSPILTVAIRGILQFCAGDTVTLSTDGSFDSYIWSNGATSATIKVAQTGLYAVSVTDKNGCKGQAATKTRVFPSVQTVFKIDNPTCAGAANGQIKVNIETGTPPYIFQWQQGAQTPTLTGLKAGQYILLVRDSANCSHIDTLILIEPKPIQAQTRMVSPNCYGEKIGKARIDLITGGTGGYKISWDNSGVDTIKTVPYTKDDMPVGQHRFTIKDRNNCLFEDTLGIYNNRIQLTLQLGDNQQIPLGNDIRITPLSNFKPLSFQWQAVGDSLKCPRCWDIDVQPLQKYVTYILRAKDSLNCAVSDTLDVRVQNLKRVFIPNAFSPNDDDVNDFFTLFGAKEVSKVAVFKIFDRWGELVFEKQNIQPNAERMGWDGSFKGKSLPPAVFVYYAVVEFVNGEREVYAGDVSLMQ